MFAWMRDLNELVYLSRSFGGASRSLLGTMWMANSNVGKDRSRGAVLIQSCCGY